MKSKKKILISGYYGFGNSGDDALLLSIIQDFDSKGLKGNIVVLSAHPRQTKKAYGVRAAGRLNPFSLLYHFMTAHLFISGGGTLIQDGTSTKSLLYYLSLISFAEKLGKKVMLYANGIGPVSRKKNRQRVKDVLSKVDVITVRDEKSLEELSALGVEGPEISLTADPVFMLDNNDNIDGLIRKYRLHDTICVSVRTTKKMNEGTFSTAFSKALDRILREYDKRVILLPLQKCDIDISRRIVAQMFGDAVVVFDRLPTDQLLSLVAHCDLCVGMRLHMLIYAACGAVPIVGVVYDPKVSGFMEYAKQDLYIDMNDVTRDSLYDLMKKAIDEHDERKEVLAKQRELLCARAAENIEKAYALYKGEN